MLVLRGEKLIGLMNPQVGANAGEHLSLANGLDHIIDAAHGKAGEFVIRVTEGGLENDRDRRGSRVVLELGANLESGLAGHHDVEEDEVRQLSRGEFSSRSTVGGFESVMPLRLQESHQKTNVIGVVVYYKDLGGRAERSRRIGFAGRGESAGWRAERGHDGMLISFLPNGGGSQEG